MHDKYEISVVAAIVKNEQGKLLITKRPDDTHLGGLWEFPGGKVEDGESHAQALVREIKEETALHIIAGELFWQEVVDYGWKIVHLYFYHCRLLSEDQVVRRLEVADFKWLETVELSAFEFPKADTELLRRLVV